MRALPALRRLVWAGVLLAMLAAVPWSVGGGGDALAQEVANPHGVAVIVGNRHYAHRDVPDVAYAHRDAAAFRRYVVEILGYDPANIIDLRDATLGRLTDVFGNERSHEGDLHWKLGPTGRSDVVVFYSGHGVPGLSDKGAYLLPTEAGPDNAEISGYPLALLYGNLAKLANARSVRVFMDTCFSGSSHAGMLISRASPVFMQTILPGEAGEKLTVLTAASSDQIASWDEDARHGLFTRHLLDALYGGGDADGDGQVTSSEAKAYLDSEMTGAAWSLRRRQNASLIEGPEAAILAANPAEGFPARRPIALMTEAGIPLEDLSPAATRLSRLLGRPFSAEAADGVGWTDLHYAAVLDLPELIGALIDAGVPVDVRLKDGSPPFGEHLQKTLIALGHEQFSESEADGETPLTIAAMANSAAAAKELVARGADIALQKLNDGMMPLHYAAMHNAVDVITALIAHGADMNARGGGDSWMPLHVAAYWNAVDATKLLVSLGADITVNSNIGERNHISDTPLGPTAYSNASDVAEVLIANGAEGNSGNLTIAVSRDSTIAVSRDSTKVATLLIESGIDVNSASEFDGETPLHEASLPEMISLLMSHGADVNAKANDGRTPLHKAVDYSAKGWAGMSPETVAALIAHGADVNAKAKDGETPLHVAARHGERQLTAALIKAGANMRAKTNAGATIVDLWETEK